MTFVSVVRQALLQNQTPEIQAKLLAMQKHMVQQKSDVKNIMPPAMPTQISHIETVKTMEVKDDKTAKPRPPMTQEQKEEHAR